MYHFHAGMYDDDSCCSDDEDEDDLVDGHDEIFQNIAQTLRKKYERKPSEKGNDVATEKIVSILYFWF